MDVMGAAERASELTGIPANLIAAQWSHESNGFTSRLAKENFNFGGLTQTEWNGDDNKQPDGGNYYRQFSSPEEYADSYANYINAYYPEARNARTPEEFARVLKEGGYYTDDESKYAAGIKGRLGGSWDLAGVTLDANAYGVHPQEVVPEIEPVPLSFGGYLKDKFLDAWNDSALIGSARNVWAGINSNNSQYLNYQVTQDDVDYVTKALPGNPVAQRWALINAQNPEHLMRLVAMKQDDDQRRERIETYKGNRLGYVAGFGASAAGSLLSDPTILLPLGQEAFLAKAIGRLGGETAAHLATSKLMRYAELAATNAGINVAERKTAEVYGGYQQNYTAAALMGAFAGAGLGALGDIIRRGPRNIGTQKVIGALDNMESHAITSALDLEAPNAVPKIREELAKLHDTQFGKDFGSDTLNKLLGSGKVLAVSKADLQTFAKRLGVDIPENTKAFHKADEDLTVLVKDAIGKDDNIDNLLAHEVGVHGNLKDSLGEKTYNDIRSAVEDRIANPSPDWLEAVKASPEGGWEEVLGHWIERNADKADPLYKRLQQGFNKVFKDSGGKAKLSDDELRAFAKRSLQDEVDRARGYTTLPDGTVILNGLKFSAANIFNPNLIAHMIDVEGRKPGIWNSISRWFESSWYYRTPFGVLTHSPSKIGRQFAEDVLADARLRERSNSALVIPVEKQKEHIQQRLNHYWSGYLDIRSKYLAENRLMATPGNMQDFNKQVREAYNAVYTNNIAGLTETKWDPLVMEGAKQIKELRDEIIRIAKNSADMFGARAENLIPKDWMPLDGEVWRRIDDDKWLKFLNSGHLTLEKATEFLQGYAEKAIKRDKVYDKLLAKKKAEYVDKLADWQERVDSLPEGEKKPRRPNKPAVSQREVDTWVKNEARDWAFGVVDQNLSNLDRFKEGEPHRLGADGFIEERVPMDTSMIVETPWGANFSYDVHLRSDDFDRIIPKTINRFAGEAALHNKYAKTEDLINERAKFAQALEHGVMFKQITKTDKDRNLEAFDEALLQIRGFRKDEDIQSRLNNVATMLKGGAYAQNAANFGANQLGETGGTFAYTGFKAVTHFIPALAKLLRDIRAGKGAGEFAEYAVERAFGENMVGRVWGTDWSSHLWQDASILGSKLRWLDKIQSTINFAGRVVSTINLLPKFTDLMHKGILADGVIDTIKWAEGKRVGLLRKPFSAKKLAAAGIKGDMVQKVQDAINLFVVRDSQGKLKEFLMDDWIKQSPETFWRWKTLVDYQSQRAMQQNTVGNRSILANQNPMTRILFQFKDYAMKVMNGQLARIMTHREIDDALAAMFSMATNTAVYAGLIYGKAWAYYGWGTPEFERYKEERLSPANLAYAAFFRSLVGTGLSAVQDIYEATTGSQSIRTTVDRSPQTRQQQRDGSDMVGDFIAQLPAIRALTDPALAAHSAAKIGLQDTDYAFKQRATQQDIKNLFRLLPLQNYIPMIKLQEMMMDDSGLPEKTRRR